MSAHSSKAGDWSLVLPRDVQLSEVTIKAPAPRDAALALEWVSGSGDVSGFVISRALQRWDARAQAQYLVDRILDAARPGRLLASASLRHLGAAHTTHDGYPAVSGTVVDLSISSEEKLSWIRNNMFPMIHGGDLGRFEGLPRSSSTSAKDFVLLLSTVSRPAEGRVLVSGGVVSFNDHESLFHLAASRAADMAHSALLARHGAAARVNCAQAKQTPPAKVDLIWVIDGSRSMEEVRTNRLHKGAVALWNSAVALGLDFRMAVLGTGRVADGHTSLSMGLCNPTIYAPGPGRFWSPPADQLHFNSCVADPAGNIPKDRISGSYGLINLRQALRSMLPRKAGDPRRLRPDARLVVIFASDVEAGSVRDLFDGEPPLHQPSGVERTRLMDHLRPFVDLVNGKSNLANAPYIPVGTKPSTLAGTRVYALVSDPDQGCGRRTRGTGYIELVQALGRGWVDQICYGPRGTEHLLTQLARDVAARLRPLTLSPAPIPSTLVVTRDGKQIDRTRKGGFEFYAPSNSLLFYEKSESTSLATGQLKLGYLYW